MSISKIFVGKADGNDVASLGSQDHTLTAGDLMVVGVKWEDADQNATYPQVTDDQGNTYTPLTKTNYGGHVYGQLWYCLNCNAGTGNPVATFSPNAAYCRIKSWQFRSTGGVWYYDRSTQTGGSGTTMQTATVLTRVAAEALVALGGEYGAGTWVTADRGDGSNWDIDDQDQGTLAASAIVSTATNYRGNFTHESMEWSLNVATFSETDPTGGAAPTVTQEGYRWRLDDGDQANATWAANQDTGITAPANTVRRLRVILDTSGDANAAQYQLEYKEANDANWTKVS